MENAPVYVKISKYKDLTKVLSKIQERLDSANKTIEQLEQLKAQEDQQIAEWRQNLENIQEKLSNVGTALHNG